MGSRQWGHGFHAGMNKRDHQDILLGKWGHILDEHGKINYQMEVVSEDKETVVVQFYEWLDGCPSIQKVFPKQETEKWVLYPTGNAMKEAYNLSHPIRRL